MKSSLNVISHSEAETLGLAEKVGLFFKSGDVIVLTGTLGAGKTVFVRGLARALQIDEDIVNSPSFTIINEYPGGKSPLYHFDLYRLDNASELDELGWDDYLQRGGIMVVEWGEKGGDWLPFPYYRVTMRIIGDVQREIDIQVIKS
ncbi:MAG: tRNA (adenosine(37)-N6)-threonylcarbamoyltransferase complex ATPase subunit type 1 TsaE [candidate division Zixibacteria bacterium]|nr:tRNA (adenosine(37)-N6)-threonylcarbamoyltransferase complex ATPase subunit type 1 TsaE [candidate division Zixibacteria bacterium]